MPRRGVPADGDSSFQFSRISMKQRGFFSVSRPSHLKCSYSETNYFKYTRGLKEGLLYARLGSKVRMNSLNRTSSLWILNSIWLALSPRGECESGSRVTPRDRFCPHVSLLFTIHWHSLLCTFLNTQYMCIISLLYYLLLHYFRQTKCKVYWDVKWTPYLYNDEHTKTKHFVTTGNKILRAQTFDVVRKIL